MKRCSIILGFAGSLTGLCTILFINVHPTDHKIHAVLINLTLLLLGTFLVINLGRIKNSSGTDRYLPVRATMLISGFFIVFAFLFPNMMLRNAANRSNILAKPLEKILLMQGKTYEWKRDVFPGENFPAGRDTGVIAQEIEKVLPELVGTRRDGFKAVAYQEIVPILIEAVKEQQKIIDSQRKEINEIKVMLQGMKK